MEQLKSQLKSYQNQLHKPYTGLNPEQLKEPDNLAKLAVWLAANDCVIMSDWTNCYKTTRIKLIKATKEWDDDEDEIFQLKSNYNSLLERFDLLIKSVNKLEFGVETKK